MQHDWWCLSVLKWTLADENGSNPGKSQQIRVGGNRRTPLGVCMGRIRRSMESSKGMANFLS